MNDLYNRIISQRSGYERILAHVPGYRGYKEASDRRAADRLLREHIVNRLKEEMAHLVAVEKKQVSAGDITFAGKTRSAKMNFQTFIDRVNTAAPGYAGFYDAIKIGPDQLEHLYAFDAAIVGYVDKFKDEIDALDKAAQAKDGVDTAVSALEAQAQEANNAYMLREQVLTGLS